MSQDETQRENNEEEDNYEFRDEQEPDIDNSLISNLLNTLFTEPLQREGVYDMSFTEYLNRGQNLDVFNNMFNQPFDLFEEDDIPIRGTNRPLFSPILSRNNSIMSFINTISNPFYDPIEQVLLDSMDNQPDALQKTDHIISIASQRFETLNEKIQEENKDCSICINSYSLDDMISITNCNHIFHTDCIKEWGKYKTQCPVCRTNLE